MAPLLYLARHGERLDFVDPDWHKTAERPDDAPLTETGQTQATKLGQLLREKNITSLYTSPFLRCIQTASAIQNELSSTPPPLNVEPGLCEWLNAYWYASSEKGPIWLQPCAVFERFPRVNRLYDPLFGYDWNFAGFPEDQATLIRRCLQTVERVLANHGEKEGNILLVGHGSSIDCLRLTLVPNIAGPPLEYCALTECVHAPTPQRPLRFALGSHNNDTSFYKQ